MLISSLVVFKVRLLALRFEAILVAVVITTPTHKALSTKAVTSK
jgi:hypothetical protein